VIEASSISRADIEVRIEVRKAREPVIEHDVDAGRREPGRRRHDGRIRGLFSQAAGHRQDAHATLASSNAPPKEAGGGRPGPLQRQWN